MRRLYLLRHAESAPSRDVLDAEWPLSPRGRQQARAIVPRLRELGVTRVRSSPYVRAVDTVTPYARAAGLEIEIDTRLRERNLANGFASDHLALIERSWSDMDFCVAGAESARECQARVVAAVAECWAGDETFLLGSHGNAIALYLHGLDGSFSFSRWRDMHNPDLFCISRSHGALTWRRVALGRDRSPQ